MGFVWSCQAHHPTKTPKMEFRNIETVFVYVNRHNNFPLEKINELNIPPVEFVKDKILIMQIIGSKKLVSALIEMYKKHARVIALCPRNFRDFSELYGIVIETNDPTIPKGRVVIPCFTSSST